MDPVVTCGAKGCGIAIRPGKFLPWVHLGHPPPVSLPHYARPAKG